MANIERPSEKKLKKKRNNSLIFINSFESTDAK